jgi:hypothetical protein
MLRSKLATLVVLMTIGIIGISNLVADDDDKFDGALWKFHMEPVAKRAVEPLNGVFRVKGKELFQKSKPRIKEFDLLIGEKTAFKPKTTWLKIDNLRARTKGGKVETGIKGKLVLKMDEQGKWSGPFIDSEGRHWDFSCERFQE